MTVANNSSPQALIDDINATDMTDEIKRSLVKFARRTIDEQMTKTAIDDQTKNLTDTAKACAESWLVKVGVYVRLANLPPDPNANATPAQAPIEKSKEVLEKARPAEPPSGPVNDIIDIDEELIMEREPLISGLTFKTPARRIETLARTTIRQQTLSANEDKDDTDVVVPYQFIDEAEIALGFSWDARKRKIERINIKIFYSSTKNYTQRLQYHKPNLPHGISQAAGLAILTGAGWSLHAFDTRNDDIPHQNFSTMLKELKKDGRQFWHYDDFSVALNAFCQTMIYYLPYEKKNMDAFVNQCRTKFDEITRAHGGDREKGMTKFLIFFREVKIKLEKDCYEFGDPAVWEDVRASLFPNAREITTRTPYHPEVNWITDIGEKIDVNTAKGLAITARNPLWKTMGQISTVNQTRNISSRTGSSRLDQSEQRGICNFFRENGWCRYDDKCKYAHPQKNQRDRYDTLGRPRSRDRSPYRREYGRSDRRRSRSPKKYDEVRSGPKGPTSPKR